MSCIFMSGNFMRCNFDGPPFSRPSFSVNPSTLTCHSLRLAYNLSSCCVLVPDYVRMADVVLQRQLVVFGTCWVLAAGQSSSSIHSGSFFVAVRRRRFKPKHSKPPVNSFHAAQSSHANCIACSPFFGSLSYLCCLLDQSYGASYRPLAGQCCWIPLNKNVKKLTSLKLSVRTTW